MTAAMAHVWQWLTGSEAGQAAEHREPIRIDPVLSLVVLALLGWGLVMVASASMELGEKYGHPFFFVIRQCGAIAAGIVLVFLLILRTPIHRYVENKGAILIAALGLLVLVLIPGVGHNVNGASRWIHVGPINIQVSEFARLGFVLWMAGYIATHMEKLQLRMRGMLGPAMVIGLASVLLLAQPDFGTTVVLVVTLFAMAWLARAQWQVMVGASAMMGVIGIALIFSAQYRVERLLSFSNPFSDPFGQGYQLANSLIAIGTGGIFGRGLGESVQKLSYLPEAHTDFIFAVLAEELGLIGVIVLIALYGVLVWRGFVIARMAWQAEQVAGAAIAWGVSVWIGLQALINMGVNMGLLPTKGLTLPLMSYGGSAMLATLLALGLLMRVHHEAICATTRREADNRSKGRQGGRT